ncbi:MAG: GNAT family N-acetyltransferase [Alphaproteobacteria bacterium]|nr:GNAT family N-acetyltransferase [Alphaproteobacteria bacterium]
MPAHPEAKPETHSLSVERKTALSSNELGELAAATEDAIRDGIGFNWLTPPMRETIESYWRGVLMVPTRILFVARLDNVIAGSIQLVRPSKSKETSAFAAGIEAHFVAPWARGHGLAPKLLDAAEREAAKEGFSVINLSVRETQARALEVYRSHGYTEWGVMPYYEFVNASMVPGHFFYKKIEPISDLI